MALGPPAIPELARRAGQSLGRDLHLFGFNMNLAPVLDVNSNPDNPVIGIRSFGENAAAVGEMGVAYIQGMQGEGVIAVAKHFPGHGDTDSDRTRTTTLPVLAARQGAPRRGGALSVRARVLEGLDAS